MQTPLCVTTFSVCECITAKESIFNLIDDCISFPPFAIRTLNPLACPLHAHVQIVNIAGALRAHWIYVRHARASRRQEHTSPSRAPTAAGFSALVCLRACWRRFGDATLSAGTNTTPLARRWCATVRVCTLACNGGGLGLFV